MEETIRIRQVDKSDWSATLQGFQPDHIARCWQSMALMGRQSALSVNL
jgi:hypothetical protein